MSKNKALTALAALALALNACGSEEPETTVVVEGQPIELQELVDQVEAYNEELAENGFEYGDPGSGCWVIEGDPSTYRDDQAELACNAIGLGITPDGFVAYSDWVGANGLLWDGERYAPVVERQPAALVVEDRPQLEQRPLTIIIDPAAELPDGVDPASQPATIAADGTITNADGTTDCVTASPCDYERAGYQPGDTGSNHPDVDPVWDSPELQGGSNG